MAEPTTSTAAALASAGLTVFGVATGLHPMLLVAGFVGGWWAHSYGDSMPVGHRLSSCVIAALVATWSTPPIVVWLTTLPVWPDAVTADLIKFFVSLVLGFLAHRVLGPAILRVASKKAEELA